MLSLESALYVRLQDAVCGRHSPTWGSAFRQDRAYRVLALLGADVGSTAYALLSTGHHQRYVPVWALRAVAFAPEHVDYEMPIDGLSGPATIGASHLDVERWHSALTQPQALGDVRSKKHVHDDDVVDCEHVSAPWLCKI